MDLRAPSTCPYNTSSINHVLEVLETLTIEDFVQSCPGMCQMVIRESVGNGNPDLSGIGVSRCLPIIDQ